MTNILKALELFEMNHEFAPAAQHDIEEIIAAVRAATVPPAVPDVICVGHARFPRNGDNAGLSWYVEDALCDAAGHRTGQPKDGELLFVLAAAQKKEGKP